LLRGSFRPEEAVCMLRTLVRDKANLVAERSDWVRRMQKSLDQMNVRVHRAVSDIGGVTGMAIMRAIANGERDAQKLAQLRDHRCNKTESEIAEQLTALARGSCVQPAAGAEDVRGGGRADRGV
jgi:transposase